MSEDIKAQFEQATVDVKQLSKAPDNMAMLRLYGLFKQSTAGDCGGARPGMMDFVGRAKYDEWKKLEGTAKEAAMQQYIDFVKELQAADGK
jgi:acyl-CoA-binding protein